MNQTKIFEAIPFLQPKLPAHDMNVRFLTAAQEALENEDVLGRLAEIILESRAMEHDAPVTNFLRVNSLWYNQMVPRLWSDTRACVLREGESTFDFHLSNILNKVRTSERQRHANYMRKARLFACHFLDGAAEAYEKVLTELDFPNLRLVELYITDSQQTFPLAPFPEVSTVVVRALQTYGHFCIDVHMVGAIQVCLPLSLSNGKPPLTPEPAFMEADGLAPYRTCSQAPPRSYHIKEVSFLQVRLCF